MAGESAAATATNRSSPPKRRRTDLNAAAPTPSQIGQANAALQHFMTGRHDRWAGHTTDPQNNHPPSSSTSAAVPTPTAPIIEIVQRDVSEGRSIDGNNTFGRAGPLSKTITTESGAGFDTGREGQDTRKRTLTEATTGEHDERMPLGRYETPEGLRNATAPIFAAQGQTDTVGGRATPPALPSPAPSDDMVIVPSTHNPRNIERISGRVTPSASATSRPLHAHGSFDGNPGTQGSVPFQQRPSSLPNEAHVHRNEMSHITPRPPQPTIAPSTMQFGNNHQVQEPRPLEIYQLIGRSLEHMRNANPDQYFNKPFMLQSFAPIYDSLSSRSLDAFNHGRLILLREAITNTDHFYIILHQLSCLRACAPQLLPVALTKIAPASWGHLDVMLCSNSDIDPRLVQWFAQFPAPINLIMGSQWRVPYEQTLETILNYLRELPRNWQSMVNACRRRHAPPLAQDMVETLKLVSPTLQTATFRAIGRMFWGYDAINGAPELMERVHLQDQRSYFLRGWRMTAREQLMAYSVFGLILFLWRDHVGSGKPVASFTGPTEEIREVFYQPPSGNRASIAGANGALGMPASQDPRQSNSTNITPRQTVSAAMPPRRTTLQTRSSLPTNASPAAQRSRNVSTPKLTGSFVYPRAEEGPRPLPLAPDTARTGLHQAHLRSPQPGPKEIVEDQPRLYRHVIGFALSPTLLNDHLPAQTISFHISKEDYEAIPRTQSNGPNSPPSRYLNETSQLYRLRCAVMPAAGFASEASWVTAENVWPDYMYIEFNEKPLEPRRKLHHGRNLPIDLSHLIREGENTLTVLLSQATQSNKHKRLEHAVAIELIGVKTHQAILDIVQPISAAGSLAAIKASLSASSNTSDNDKDDNEDDDLVLTSSILTIQLFDPISACRMFDIPVRGASCLHKDPFDLAAFLSQCKRDAPGFPSVVDCWRCPVCRGDVRPQTLVSDGFLAGVRASLAVADKLHVRAIVVEADGSWREKEEEKTGRRSASLEREERVAAVAAAGAAGAGSGGGTPASNTKAVGKRVLEVIELD